MPDASDPRGRPFGWGDAFAALPADVPPADGWARVAARLDARAAHRSSPEVASMPARMTGAASRRPRRFVRGAGWLGAAAAAALALVVAWPRHDAPQVFPKPREVASPASVAPDAVAAAAPAAQPAASQGLDAAAATRKPRVDPTAIALPKAVQAARKPRYAARATPARGKPARADADAATRAIATAAGTGALDALYTESARLEALLDLARDDRVASAGAALLAAELDAQVAGIDARLAQPGLGDAQRAALWQARVDALRQAAGFESTQRVLASQGDGGALLVSVD
ncbi:MAG TPA: hypothetical protein VFT52_00740 [Luteimonas sp.]|nr:hypothetical protein [Luteimonas sp.]